MAVAATLARVLLWCGRRGRTVGAVAHVCVGLAGLVVRLGLLALRMLLRRSLHPALADDHVDAAFGVLLEGLVVVAWFGVLGDYVPGMDEARDLEGVSAGCYEMGKREMVDVRVLDSRAGC